MNAPKSFIDLVYSAETKQEYIGMGNPNANILIIGREPAHDLNSDEGRENYRQDQTLNRTNWKNLIEGKAIEGRCNPRHPFPNQKCLRDNGNNNGTAATWVWYQKLVDLILNRKDGRPYRLRPLDFHEYCFHTDISSAAAKGQKYVDRKLKEQSVSDRSTELFSREFFRRFPIVILSVGNGYITDTWCNDILGYPTSEAEKAFNKENGERMLWINRDSHGHRILVHTQFLSRIPHAYIEKIRGAIRADGFTADLCKPEKY